MGKPATVPAPLAVWDMQPGESAKAYQAFRTYRDMGEGRTMAAVGARLSKSRQLLTRWASANDWAARVAAFDAEVERHVSIASVDTHAEALTRQAEQAREIARQAYSRLTVAESKDADGNPVTIQFDPLELTPAEAGRLWRDAVKEERDALRIPASVAVTGADGGPVTIEVLIDLSAGSGARGRDDGDESP